MNPGRPPGQGHAHLEQQPPANLANVDHTRPPGLLVGATQVFTSLGFVLRSPRLWPAALVPAVILLVFSAALVTVSVVWLRPVFASFMPDGTEWYYALGADIMSWVATILASVLGLLLALAITPPLSAPALEHMVAARERDLGVPPREPLGFFAEMLCGLRAQLLAALLAVPLLLLLAVVELVFPIAAVVTVPLKCIVVSMSLAWNLFDYPLTLRGIRMRDRYALLKRHLRPTLGFGLAFSALFWVPCFSVLLLPVGVVGATGLLWQILLYDRDAVPTLERPAPRE